MGQVQWENCDNWMVGGYWLLRVCSCPLWRLLLRQRRRLPGPVQALRAEGARLCLLHSLPTVKKCTSSENSRMPQWLFGLRWEGGWAPCRSRTPGCTWHLIWTSWTFNQPDRVDWIFSQFIHL